MFLRNPRRLIESVAAWDLGVSISRIKVALIPPLPFGDRLVFFVESYLCW
jgi:hypothetical protein